MRFGFEPVAAQMNPLSYGGNNTVFLLFSSFQYSWQFLPMTGFEPRNSGVGGVRSTNWVTTTTLLFDSYLHYLVVNQPDFVNM